MDDHNHEAGPDQLRADRATTDEATISEATIDEATERAFAEIRRRSAVMSRTERPLTRLGERAPSHPNADEGPPDDAA